MIHHKHFRVISVIFYSVSDQVKNLATVNKLKTLPVHESTKLSIWPERVAKHTHTAWKFLVLVESPPATVTDVKSMALW